MNRITFGYVDFHPSDQRRILEVYKSGQYSPGPMCREFETRFKTYQGSKHALFLNSGTDALRVGLLALKEKYRWPDGSCVIVPSITFVASLNAVIQAGLTPMVQDVGMYDYNMNPEWLERLLSTSPETSNIKAMMAVHMFGQIAPMREIMKVAKKHHLRVIEDSCESVGSTEHGKKCGTFGDVSCFSTYQCHVIATGVGGMATTNDDKLHELMRSYANHGRDTTYLPGYRTPALSKKLVKSRFRFVRTGYSCRPSEFEAALGIGQMDRLDHILEKRRAVADSLLTVLVSFKDLKLPVAEQGRTHSYMMFPIVIHQWSSIKKADLVWHLEQCGIETRDMMPITTQPVFKGLAPDDNSAFPLSVAKWVNEKGFYIPCHPGMVRKDIERIRLAFLDFFKK